MKTFLLLFVTIVLSAGVFGFFPLAHAQFEPAPGSPVYQAAQAQVPAAQAAAAAPAPTTGGTGFTALAPIPGLTEGRVANSKGLAQFLNQLYIYIVGLAATLAVIEIIIGGLQISTESVTKKSVGKQRITQALLGLVLVLSPALVFGIINPSILNLSVNIPRLQTKWGSWAPPAPCAGTSCVTANPGGMGVSTGNKEYACSSSNCSAAETQCTSGNPGTGWSPVYAVVCLKSDGTIDTSGRSDSAWNPFSSYSCVSGERLSINCGYVLGTQ